MKPIGKFARMLRDDKRPPTQDDAMDQVLAVTRLANELNLMSTDMFTKPDKLRQAVDQTVALQNKARQLERTLLALTEHTE